MPSLSLSLRERCRDGPGPSGNMPAPAGSGVPEGGGPGGILDGDDITPRHSLQLANMPLTTHSRCKGHPSYVNKKAKRVHGVKLKRESGVSK